MVVNKSNKTLYVVTKGDSTLFEVDTRTHKITRTVKLPGAAYSCLLSPGDDKLYISLWVSSSVAVYNTATGSITSFIKGTTVLIR